MRGQPDLFGEIHEDEIVKIAWEAAEKRGYAIYDDDNEYMRPAIDQRRPAGVGFSHLKIESKIKETLERNGWIHSSGHPETRFNPPSTEKPKTN